MLFTQRTQQNDAWNMQKTVHPLHLTVTKCCCTSTGKNVSFSFALPTADVHVAFVYVNTEMKNNTPETRGNVSVPNARPSADGRPVFTFPMTMGNQTTSFLLGACSRKSNTPTPRITDSGDGTTPFQVRSMTTTSTGVDSDPMTSTKSASCR